MLRIIDGHARLMTGNPPLPLSSSWPASSTIVGWIPGNGNVQEPGLSAVAPGKGEIMWEPVSVCHQVSTMGQREPPTVVWYHIHASGLMGSPTDPRSLKLERSNSLGRSGPTLINERM